MNPRLKEAIIWIIAGAAILGYLAWRADVTGRAMAASWR